MAELNLLYLHTWAMGYGRMGSAIADELTKIGVNVYDGLDGTCSDEGFERFIGTHITGKNAGRSNVCCWITVPSHARGWFNGQVPVIYTMYETNRLPDGFTDRLHEFDTVVVPSPQNYEMFQAYHDNVKYVPLGVDPVRWYSSLREMPTTEFRILVGGAGERKGIDVAVRAFRKVFRNVKGPVPKLTIKGARADHYGQNITNITTRLTDDEEVDLYRNTHLYLGPSRGEGFGLMPLQAIASGAPTILTNAHGHGAYAHLGLPIDAKEVPGGYFIYGTSGEWWEPDFDQLCDRLWDVYVNYDAHRHRAFAQGQTAGETFNWRNTALDLVNAIGTDRLGPYTGDGTWHNTVGELFKIVTNRDWSHEVAGAFLAYQRGVEYWESADVKRILFEAGILDPVCLDGNHGLAPEQVDKLGHYRALHENCPTCGQRLNQEATV